MKVVNINDIEDLILCKHEIDNLRIKNKEIDKRTTLEEFMTKFINPMNNVYMSNNRQIPFKIIEYQDNKYLLVTDDIDSLSTKTILDKLITINYDFSRLKPITYNQMILTDNLSKLDLFVIDNKYYVL